MGIKTLPFTVASVNVVREICKYERHLFFLKERLFLIDYKGRKRSRVLWNLPNNMDWPTKNVKLFGISLSRLEIESICHCLIHLFVLFIYIILKKYLLIYYIRLIKKIT